MKRTILQALLFLPALATLSCTVVTRSAPTAPDTDLATLARYRQWTLVNPEPQFMKPASAIDCAMIQVRQEPSPHLNKWVSVYVNPVGREQMMTKLSPKFPIGSMIVKEKLGSVDSKKPEMLTAMIKREPGYNPEGGDWEYLVLDGSALMITERGKLKRCSGCHQPYDDTDFVTRTYLPRTVLSELRP